MIAWILSRNTWPDPTAQISLNIRGQSKITPYPATDHDNENFTLTPFIRGA